MTQKIGIFQTCKELNLSLKLLKTYNLKRYDGEYILEEVLRRINTDELNLFRSRSYFDFFMKKYGNHENALFDAFSAAFSFDRYIRKNYDLSFCIKDEDLQTILDLKDRFIDLMYKTKYRLCVDTKYIEKQKDLCPHCFNETINVKDCFKCYGEGFKRNFLNHYVYYFGVNKALFHFYKPVDEVDYSIQTAKFIFKKSQFKKPYHMPQKDLIEARNLIEWVLDYYKVR